MGSLHKYCVWEDAEIVAPLCRGPEFLGTFVRNWSIRVGFWKETDSDMVCFQITHSPTIPSHPLKMNYF